MPPTTCRGHHRSTGGFTMMELLVAMLFITLALTGLATLQIHSIRQVTETRQATEALKLAESVLARYSDTVITFPQLPQPLGAGPAWEFERMKGAHHGNLSTMVNVAVDGESDGPFTVERLIEVAGLWVVTIRVSWRASTAGVDDPTQPCAFPRRCVMVSMQRSG